jgi:hypothetical protein
MTQSEQHFKNIIEGNLSVQLKNSIRRIKAACDALDGLKAEISVMSVCKQIKHIYGEKTGPIAGTIRNDKDRLLEYLNLRKSEQVLPQTKSGAIPKYEIPPISDERVRSYVTLIANQNRQLISENNRLKNAFKKLSPIDLKTLLLPVSDLGLITPEALAPGAQALQGQNLDWVLLAEVAEKFLNPPQDFYLEVAEIDGEKVLRMKTNKKVLLMPKYMRALRSLIDNVRG